MYFKTCELFSRLDFKIEKWIPHSLSAFHGIINAVPKIAFDLRTEDIIWHKFSQESEKILWLLDTSLPSSGRSSYERFNSVCHNTTCVLVFRTCLPLKQNCLEVKNNKHIFIEKAFCGCLARLWWLNSKDWNPAAEFLVRSHTYCGHSLESLSSCSKTRKKKRVHRLGMKKYYCNSQEILSMSKIQRI